MRIKRMMAALLAGIMVFGTMTTTCLAAQTDDEEVTETEAADTSEDVEATDTSEALEVTIAEDGSYTFTYGGHDLDASCGQHGQCRGYR